VLAAVSPAEGAKWSGITFAALFVGLCLVGTVVLVVKNVAELPGQGDSVVASIIKAREVDFPDQAAAAYTHGDTVVTVQDHEHAADGGALSPQAHYYPGGGGGTGDIFLNERS